MANKNMLSKLLDMAEKDCQHCGERHNVWPGMHIKKHIDGTCTYKIDYWCKECLENLSVLRYYTVETTE